MKFTPEYKPFSLSLTDEKRKGKSNNIVLYMYTHTSNYDRLSFSYLKYYRSSDKRR